MPNGGAAEFYAATAKFGKALQDDLKTGVKEAALFTKTSIMAQPGYPHNPLRGTARRGRGGRKASVRYDIKGTVNPTAIVQANGPFPLVERPTRAHMLGAKKMTSSGRARLGRNIDKRTGRAKKSYRYANAEGPRLYSQAGKPMLVNGSWRQGPFAHPGTRGKHPFEHGVRVAEPYVVGIFKRNTTMALASTLAKTFT